MALDHIRDTDRLAVEQAGRVLGYICLANKYLSEVGLFTHPQGESLDAKPLMHTVERYEQMLNRILVNLGLTPASRIKLKLDKKGRKTLGELIHEAENAPK
jgi:P27 family predicted phage terminase small subunit